MVKRSKLFDWAGQQGSFAQHRGHEFVDQRSGCRSLVQGFQVGAQQVLLVGEDGVINLLQYLVSPFILMVIVCDGTVCDSYTGKAPPIVIFVTILHGILTVGSLP
jgi:hypothetical protein